MSQTELDELFDKMMFEDEELSERFNPSEYCNLKMVAMGFLRKYLESKK
jgi:hypothetical protein